MRRHLIPCMAAVWLTMSLMPAGAQALLELRFVTPPSLPTLPTLTLNARTQTISTAMTSFSVEDVRLTKAGWNLTAQGQSGTGRSPVFAPYCPKAKCGVVAEGYVPEGQSMAAESLTLNSTGASLAGGLLTAPTFQCSSGCALDSPTPVKIASEATGLLAGEGVWTASGFSPTSLALSAPATLRVLPNEEVYRANILWTLSTGP
jgi:hypothetical protein